MAMGLDRVVSTHSRPKAAAGARHLFGNMLQFQHTAARRRLHIMIVPRINIGRFNTQPPEGGCAATCLLCPIMPVSTHSRPKAADLATVNLRVLMMFQHTAARRRLPVPASFPDKPSAFQHTAARRRLAADRQRLAVYRCFNTQPPEGGWPFIS